MKIIKYLLFLVLLVIIGTAIYFGTKDGSYVVRGFVMVPAAPEVVYDEVNNLKNWEEWNNYDVNKSDIVITYSEKSTGEGASLSWEGGKKGSLTTIKAIPYSEILQEMTFQTSRGKRHADITWKFEEATDSTKVVWEMRGEHTLMDKAYNAISGSDFIEPIKRNNLEALNALSAKIVEDMNKYQINIDGVTKFGGGYYMYTTSVAKDREVRKKSGDMIRMVRDFIDENHLSQSGAPFILYNDIDHANNTVIFSTGIFVKEKVITPEGSPVVHGFMEPVSAVKISLKGNYRNLPEAFSKGMDYINEENLKIDPARKIFEIHATDPKEEPNPAKWVSEVYLPIKPTEEKKTDSTFY